MAKVVFKKSPKSAYEWAEVEGGETMSSVQRAALLDEFVEENGLVPVETTFRGESPDHKYGRYIAGGKRASALPRALPSRTNDLNRANEELEALRAENARLAAQLDKKPSSSGANVVEGNDAETRGTAAGGPQSTDDAREVINQSLPEGMEIATSSEPRVDSGTNDKSADNPPVKQRAASRRSSKAK